MAGFGVSNLRKFKVLTWKTLKIKARHYVETTLNLVVPTLLFIVVVVLRYELGGDFKPTHEPASSYPAVNDLSRVCDLLEYAGSRFLYTPASEGTNATMERFLQHLKFFQSRDDTSNDCLKLIPTIEAVKDEDALVRQFEIQQNEGDNSTDFAKIGAGIVFDPKYDFFPDGKLPDLIYKIRMNPDNGIVETQTNLKFPLFATPGPRGGPNITENYEYGKFSVVQMVLDYSYIELQSSKTLLPREESDWTKIEMWPLTAKMPYPSYHKSTSLLIFLLAFFVVLSFTFIIPPITKRVVQEKKSGAKELMKMMGLPPWMNWLFHFLDAVVSVIISLIIIVVLIKVPWKGDVDGSVLEYSDPVVLFIFFLLYAMSLIVLLFAISTLFNNRKFFSINPDQNYNKSFIFSANLAMTAAIVVHMIGYFLISGLVTPEVYATMSGGLKVLLAILYPNVTMYWGVQVIFHWENLGQGSTWSNLFDRAVPEDPITMGVLWSLVLVNLLLFGLITWYMDKVKPGPYGVAEKWYFVFHPNYWINNRSKVSAVNEDSEMEQRTKEFFETEENNGTAGVEVSNLKKVFKSLSGT